MIQKASHYLSIGKIFSNKLSKGNKINFLKYMIFNLASMIGKLFPLSFPLFTSADYHITKTFDETNKFDLIQAFDTDQSSHRYWLCVKIALLNMVITITGLLFIGSLSFGLIVLGIQLDDRFLSNWTLFFQIICGIILIVFLIAKHLYFAPVFYLLNDKQATSIAEIIQLRTKFVNTHTSKKLLHFIFDFMLKTFGLTLLLTGLLILSYSRFWIYWATFNTIIASLVFIVLLTRFMLVHRIAITSLLSDTLKEFEIVNDSESHEKDLDKPINKELTEELLMYFFDEITEMKQQSPHVERSEINGVIQPEVETESEILSETGDE